MTSVEVLSRAVRTHLATFLGPPGETLELENEGASTVRRLRVPLFLPENDFTLTVLATVGASAFAMADGARLEGLLILRKEPPRALYEDLAALLASFASYAETHGAVLDVGDVIPAREALAPLCAMSSLLLLPPFPLGPEVAAAQLEDETRVDFTWLVPVHEAEADYAMRHGAQALVGLCTVGGVDLLRLDRACANTAVPPPDPNELEHLLRALAPERPASYLAEPSGSVIKITKRGGVSRR
jgi:hypothetical protein